MDAPDRFWMCGAIFFVACSGNRFSNHVPLALDYPILSRLIRGQIEGEDMALGGRAKSKVQCRSPVKGANFKYIRPVWRSRRDRRKNRKLAETDVAISFFYLPYPGERQRSAASPRHLPQSCRLKELVAVSPQAAREPA